MYILIRDSPIIDIGHVVLAAAHASLSGYLTFVEQEEIDMPQSKYANNGYKTITEIWAKESFRKVICKVNDAEFTQAKTYGTNMVDYRIMVESGLNNMEVAIVFKPRDTSEDNSLNHFLKSLKLYR